MNCNQAFPPSVPCSSPYMPQNPNQALDAGAGFMQQQQQPLPQHTHQQPVASFPVVSPGALQEPQVNPIPVPMANGFPSSPAQLPLAQGVKPLVEVAGNSQTCQCNDSRSRSCGVPGTEERRSASGSRSGKRHLVDGPLPDYLNPWKMGSSVTSAKAPGAPAAEPRSAGDLCSTLAAQDDDLLVVDVTLSRSRPDEKWGLSLQRGNGCRVSGIVKNSPADTWNLNCPLPQYEIRVGDVLIRASETAVDQDNYGVALGPGPLFVDLIFLRKPRVKSDSGCGENRMA